MRHGNYGLDEFPDDWFRILGPSEVGPNEEDTAAGRVYCAFGPGGKRAVVTEALKDVMLRRGSKVRTRDQSLS